MKAVFVELPSFARHRDAYLDEEGFRQLQLVLTANPEDGDVIKGAGGLRKARFGDPRRRKGQRGGLRVIYFWWERGAQFWLFTVYDKNELDDLSSTQRRALKELLEQELRARGNR